MFEWILLVWHETKPVIQATFDRALLNSLEDVGNTRVYTLPRMVMASKSE